MGLYACRRRTCIRGFPQSAASCNDTNRKVRYDDKSAKFHQAIKGFLREIN